MFYNNKLADSTNKPKTTWSIIKTITNNKKNPNNILMLETDGKITTHHQTTAEEFNNYYVSVADNITDDNPVNNTIGYLNKNNLLNYLYFALQQSFTNIKLKYITTGETEKVIKELKSKKSCGYDEITTKIVKISSLFIVAPLTYICNRMLSTGTFPDRLKFSEIKPINKKR